MANRNDPPAASRPSACLALAPVGLAGAFGSVGDPDGTRAITAIVALLVVLGLGLVMLTVWLFRATRPDPEVLAPLEVMSERKWRRADPVWQRRRLDEVRPPGAEPLQPSVAPPDLDEAFDLGPAASGFDDLQDSGDRDAVSIPGDPLVAGLAAPGAADPTAAVRRNGSLKIGPFAPPMAPDEPQAASPVEPPGATERPTASSLVDPLLRAAGAGGTTPTGIPRPTPEDLPDHEIDPALMAAAMAELDAELSHRRRDDDAPHDS